MAKYAFIVRSHRLASSSFPERFLGRPAFSPGMVLLLLLSRADGSGFCWRYVAMRAWCFSLVALEKEEWKLGSLRGEGPSWEMGSGVGSMRIGRVGLVNRLE